MKYLAEGLAVFDDVYLRSEELIKLANDSPEWRPGTAGGDVNDDVRVTDVFDLKLDRTPLEKELIQELVDTFMFAVEQYGQRYPHLQITKAENLRIMRYTPGGFYKQHIDSADGKRTLSGILYLNTDVDGGNTLFPLQEVEVEPRAGRLLLFPSNFIYPHESTEVSDKVKYAVVVWFS